MFDESKKTVEALEAKVGWLNLFARVFAAELHVILLTLGRFVEIIIQGRSESI